jgi:hypothetical protein
MAESLFPRPSAHVDFCESWANENQEVPTNSALGHPIAFVMGVTTRFLGLSAAISCRDRCRPDRDARKNDEQFRDF